MAASLQVIQQLPQSLSLRDAVSKSQQEMVAPCKISLPRMMLWVQERTVQRLSK